MDAQRLDDLSRRLAGGPSRRAVLGGVSLLLGGVLAGRRLLPAPPALAGEEGWVEDEAFGGFCRLPGFPCGRGQQCCAGGCSAEGTCGCRRRGRRARIAAICCSGKKKRGNKGVCR